jgi:hypothetical protein
MLAALALLAAAMPAEAVVQRQVEAYNRGDIAAFADCYAEDVEVYDLGPAGPPRLNGRAALKADFEPMLAKFHPQARIKSRIVHGDYIIDDEELTAGGRSMSGAVIYQVENGKIRRMWTTP